MEKVWNIRNDHMLPDIPTQYCFVLICCMKVDCAHPVCKSGKIPHHSWYEGGPLGNSVPLPIPDSARPWGSVCKGCEDKAVIPCHGHFLCPADIAKNSTLSPIAKPPSLVIKEAFKK